MNIRELFGYQPKQFSYFQFLVWMNIRKLFGPQPKEFSYIVTFLLSLDGRSRRSLAKRAAAMGRWLNPLFPRRTPCFSAEMALPMAAVAAVAVVVLKAAEEGCF